MKYPAIVESIVDPRLGRISFSAATFNGEAIPSFNSPYDFFLPPVGSQIWVTHNSTFYIWEGCYLVAESLQELKVGDPYNERVIGYGAKGRLRFISYEDSTSILLESGNFTRSSSTHNITKAHVRVDQDFVSLFATNKGNASEGNPTSSFVLSPTYAELDIEDRAFTFDNVGFVIEDIAQFRPNYTTITSDTFNVDSSHASLTGENGHIIVGADTSLSSRNTNLTMYKGSTVLYQDTVECLRIDSFLENITDSDTITLFSDNFNGIDIDDLEVGDTIYCRKDHVYYAISMAVKAGYTYEVTGLDPIQLSESAEPTLTSDFNRSITLSIPTWVYDQQRYSSEATVLASISNTFQMHWLYGTSLVDCRSNSFFTSAHLVENEFDKENELLTPISQAGLRNTFVKADYTDENPPLIANSVVLSASMAEEGESEPNTIDDVWIDITNYFLKASEDTQPPVANRVYMQAYKEEESSKIMIENYTDSSDDTKVNKLTLDSDGILIEHQDGTTTCTISEGVITISDGTNEVKIDSSGVTFKAAGADLWQPNFIQACLFTGAPHGGVTAGITGIKGEAS